MNLKLQLLANNEEKTWTLKPTRDYLVGTSSDHDIKLVGLSVDVNLKLIYDEYSNIWYVSDLSNRGNLLIDNQQLRDYAIKSQSTITVDRGVILTIIPERIQAPNHQLGAASQTNNSKDLRKLTWSQYVDECARVQGANRFSLITGYRFTPWVRDVGSNNFASFDGYIIPDFQEKSGGVQSSNSNSVFIALQNKLSEMKVGSSGNRKYHDTDSCIVSLTDAHIIDSSTRDFLWSWFWVEFFPVKRGIPKKRSDYRDFCLVAFNQVKTYLLVENYGSDLFVSWITRYEPHSSRALIIKILLGLISFLPFLGIEGYVKLTGGNFSGMGVIIASLFFIYICVVDWLKPTARLLIVIVSALLVLILLFTASQTATYRGIDVFLFSMIPIFSWMTFYWLAPDLMMLCNIVPKKANANFLAVISSLSVIVLLLFLFPQNFFVNIIWLWGAISAIITPIILVFQAVAIVSMFNPPSIPPLDLIDAKKLDDAVSKQVESVLKPMLEKSSYTTEQIGQILTRTSLGRTQFRR
jgi:hypothetical protein